MELLKVENIVATYDKELIVNDISFEMKKNEFIALLGLNGTGKTTLLKVLCGLLKAKSGRCIIEGKDIYQYNEKQRARHISYMPQRHSIVYDTRAIDIVLMGITPYIGVFSYPTKEDRQIAYGVLERMGIEELADANFLQLSEGQKQLIIIARSLMQDSEIMLFDEPNSALDFNNSHMVLSKIRQVVKNEKKAGLITMHDPNMALSYCDKIIIMKDNKKFADFYTADVDHEFLRKIFKEVYGKIDILEYKGKYLILK